jgi:integrase
VYQRTGRKPWWIKYYDRNGKALYESSGSNSRSDAERLLKKRLAEVASGRRLVGAAVERTTFEELERLIVDDYQLRRRKSLDSLLQSFRALRRHFGGWRAIDIGYAELTHYASQRLSECKPATVRREVVLLHRAFVLGRGAEKVSQIPRFPTISVDNARSGFFEPDEWHEIRERLPVHHQDACDFANLTGWRIMEVFGLRWADVDFQTGFVRLAGRKTKSGRARSFPFRAMPELHALLERRRAQTDVAQRAGERIIPHVFHDADGRALFGADQRPKKSFRRAWRRACLDAGYPGRIPHDFRRTVVRNLERSGVARSVAMELIGHRTESVYQRYDIVAERDLAEGVARYVARLR